MRLVTLHDATDELGISNAELLRAVMERRIPRPSMVFGWALDQFERVRAHYASTTKTREELNGR